MIIVSDIEATSVPILVHLQNGFLWLFYISILSFSYLPWTTRSQLLCFSSSTFSSLLHNELWERLNLTFYRFLCNLIYNHGSILLSLKSHTRFARFRTIAAETGRKSTPAILLCLLGNAGLNLLRISIMLRLRKFNKMKMLCAIFFWHENVLF